MVAAQLASRFRASCVGDPGSAVYDAQALAGIGGEREGFERQVEVADDRVVDELHAGGVNPDVWAAHRPRNSSLRVDSSPIRSDSRRS